MPNTFKKVIDRQMWVQSTPNINAHAAGASVASDLRNNVTRNPFVYFLGSNAVLNRYNVVQKSWQRVSTTPLTAGTFAAGATSWFAPSFGAVGTIAAGATTTSVVISTALPSAVGVNQLANRGGSGEFGYRLRIIDTTAGKTEERWIVANTSGTTPTITLDAALTFTPATGARYELLSGRLYMIGATSLAAGAFRSFEVATNTFASRSITNLPASLTTDSAATVLDEQYVPYNHRPGEGMVKGATVYDTASSLSALAATAAAASTLTGQASGGDAVIAANEYRNFQVRVVADATTPAAVGQRRVILHHTAGPSPVYTLGSAWTTTPSAAARYVIELPNLVLLRTTANTATYVYNYADASYVGAVTIASDAWNATWIAAAPGNHGVGNVWAPSWGIQPDIARNARHAFYFNFRGGAVTTLDLLDLAGGTGTPTGGVPPLWTGAVVYDGGVDPFNAGTTAAHSPFGGEGRYTYLNLYVASQIAQVHRFDALNRVLSPHVATDFIQSGTATVGARMAAFAAIDGTDLYDCVFMQSNLSQLTQELIPLV
jgi:hypothetical protein